MSRKPRVYIAGPITKGNLGLNINNATDAFWELLRAGFAPLCPHWSAFAGGIVDTHIGPMAKAERLPCDSTHEDWMGLDLPWVAVSDCVLRLPGESAGADIEVEEARKENIPVFLTVEEIIRWNQSQMELSA
jgi:hypothetical protein